ncbi:histidine kinase, partial [Dactylosporangium sp. NPDC005572]|uniref:sensor histidine kinase n=1 Tax=Dactylosporangium sp. NPDC005572 TaxID=3156889 RepID=UPI0033A44F15
MNGTARRLAGAVALSAAATAAWLVTGRGEFWPRWVAFAAGVVLLGEALLRRALRRPPGPRRWLAVDAAVCGLIATADLAVYVLTGGGYFWPAWTILGLSGIVALHAWAATRENALATRVTALTRSRRTAVDRQAAELKRVERDLHDGAQARLVSLALTLGLAKDLVGRDAGSPEHVARLVEEARQAAVAALDDLRAVMHSIHPAVLADRGLADAVRALALDLAVPATVSGDPPAPLSPATETAVYFAVAEALANVVKHSGATHAEVAFTTTRTALRVDIRDDGTGGADPAAGTGLR